MTYITDFLREALKERDVKKIRNALRGYFEANPAFRTNDSGRTDYDDAVSYIKSNYSDLYVDLFEEHDATIFPSASASPEDQYYQISAALGRNFSRERIESLRKVGSLAMNNAKVYKDIGGSVSTYNNANVRYEYQNTNPQNSANNRRYQNDSKKVNRHQKKNRGLLLVAAVVIVVAGVLLVLITVRK